MDLRVGQRLVRPGSDTAMLTPLPHPLLLSPFSPQPSVGVAIPCSDFPYEPAPRVLS
ncbi:hypothetical protein Z043_123699 [Scleropages formosus]|uniref:Uncharacterized protein n=1 Tax=Scleropages formosus TaxID=113540 RepID=A0A0P7TX15_SCLFO|nr:hypothetical protein Z043_123699 [Scleropages formosus]